MVRNDCMVRPFSLSKQILLVVIVSTAAPILESGKVINRWIHRDDECPEDVEMPLKEPLWCYLFVE